jgi:hypothetical protein
MTSPSSPHPFHLSERLVFKTLFADDFNGGRKQRGKRRKYGRGAVFLEKTILGHEN